MLHTTNENNNCIKIFYIICVLKRFDTDYVK